MNENTQQSPEPTVDDLRVKLCYICREEERHDSAPFTNIRAPHTLNPLYNLL
jgi:hypothetical protein